MRRRRRRPAGGRPSCTAPPPSSPPREPARHKGHQISRVRNDPAFSGVRSAWDLGGRTAHRFGGEGRRRRVGVERGDHELVGHAAPALPAAATEQGHLRPRRRRRDRGGRVVGGAVGLEDVGEGQPGGTVDGEPVGAPLAIPTAGRHRAGEWGGAVATVAGGGERAVTARCVERRAVTRLTGGRKKKKY
jgi:hypothetical protein